MLWAEYNVREKAEGSKMSVDEAKHGWRERRAGAAVVQLCSRAVSLSRGAQTQACRQSRRAGGPPRSRSPQAAAAGFPRRRAGADPRTAEAAAATQPRPNKCCATACCLGNRACREQTELAGFTAISWVAVLTQHNTD